MPYMSIKEASEYYNVTENKLRRLCRNEEIKAVKLGKCWRVWVDEERPAQAIGESTGQVETVQSCTLGGNFTCKIN